MNNPKPARHLSSLVRFATCVAAALAIVAITPAAWALLPPPIVECCQARDFQSTQCARFELTPAKCEKALADWVELYKKFYPPPIPPAVTEKSGVPPALPRPAPQKLAPVRVEARLYYSHTGTFSEVIDDKMRFWNTIIGEGGAKEPSHALRVDVVLQGEPGSFDPAARVTIAVTDADSGKSLSRQTASTGVLSDTGEYHATFLLQNTGCIPLKITARVTRSTVVRSAGIPFKCGE